MNTKLIVSILVLVGGLLISTSTQAQVAISEEGVTFPDDKQQTAAVIVPMNCPHGDAIVWDFNADSWVCASDLSPIICPCAVGETGPGGGIVFHVTDGGLHGLEAAPALDPDQSIDTRWCPTNSDIVDVDNIGSAGIPDGHSGAHNTPLIADVCGYQIDHGIQDSAAGVAAYYTFPGGQQDGFLPNKEELNLLYLQKDVVRGFGDYGYWSSSEYDVNRAWLQYFQDGSQADRHKADYPGLRVRVVRAF